MTTKPTYEVLVCAFNSKGELLTVNRQDVLQLPRGEPSASETQRQAAVRILKEQTGFNVQENDMVALVYDKLKDNHFVLSYLCTKALVTTDRENLLAYNCSFMGTREFLEKCVYAEYHHTALYHANIINKQMQLPNVFSQTQIVKHREAHKGVKKITVESKLNKEKEPEMQTQQEPKVKTYTYNEVCGAIADAYHKGVSDGKAEIISAGADKLYSTQEMIKLTDDSFFKGVDQGVSRATTFSTSEIQSLIAQQSKIITALESEILDLKETAGYLGGNPNSRLQELRKKIYNEITSKQKRLGKLVALQTKLKRAK